MDRMLSFIKLVIPKDSYMLRRYREYLGGNNMNGVKSWLLFKITDTRLVHRDWWGRSRPSTKTTFVVVLIFQQDEFLSIKD